MNEPLLLRVEEVAKQLQVGRNKVYELAAEGKIPSLYVGRKLRIPSEELRERIREAVRTPGRTL